MVTYWEKAKHSWSEDSLRYYVTPSQKAKEMLFYIQEIGRFKAYKEYFTERQHLNSFLIVYTVAGSGRLVYGKQEMKVKQGDIFFIDCMNYQYYNTISEEDWEIYWVHINGSNTRAFYEEYSRRGGVVCRSKSTQIPELMEQLIHLQRLKTGQTEFRTSQLLTNLLTEVVLSQDNLNFDTKDIPDYVTSLRTLFENEFNQKFTLDELAKRYAVNKYQLVKEFSKYIGSSPMDYLINVRITYAKDMLRYTNKSISEIASDVGVKNTTHFIYLFKTRTDMTPLQYRKQWK